ncbi:hypothetical protein FOL47_010631 [Perkinsus chesapeaki]|uniref:Choline transporter-like protein n=1 Tax=Perkinsus chesapeaki TaxID=330153 RepID=A0A7J6MP80_PERCH|nr:hypothetical protein FOL47_010631 [Perkinsus chesapeaki]
MLKTGQLPAISPESSTSTPAHGFGQSIKWRDRSKPGSLDYCCIFLFWTCALAQLICGIVVASSTNYTRPFINDDALICPNGYNFAITDCVGEATTLLNPRFPVGLLQGVFVSLFSCVNDSLCNEIRACTNSRSLTETSSRSLAEFAETAVAADLWEALGDYWFIPTTIFPAMVVIALLWLLASEYLPRALVWSTLGSSVVFLIALWALWTFEYGINNWMLLVVAGIVVILSAVFYKSINRAAKVMSVAASGLRSTPSIIVVCLLLKGIFVGYVILWIFFMVRSAQTKELNSSDCSLRSSPGIGFARFLFGLLFWIFTYVFLNMKTVVCAAGIGAWYFPNGDGEPTVPALKGLQWAFTSSSGAVMFAATIVGVTRFILNRIGNACHCLPWFLTPLGCLWKCFTCCCLSILEAFSKFAIIGQVFAGGSFCGAGRRSFLLIKDRLGKAFITDGVGHTVVSAITYLFPFSLGVASWLWLDAAQGYQTLSEVNTFLLIPILLAFALLISTPVFTVVLITWLSPLLHQWTCGDDGCDSAIQADAQRAINSVTGALFIGSVCFTFFNFLADVILCSIDTVFFCFAIEVDTMGYQRRLEGAVYSKLQDAYELNPPSDCSSSPHTACEEAEANGQMPPEGLVSAQQATLGYVAASPGNSICYV